MESKLRRLIKFHRAPERADQYSIESIRDGEGLRIFLNKGKSSWVDMLILPAELLEQLSLETLWDLHPETRGKVKIMGKEHLTPRYQQTYGHGYTFTGMYHPPLPTPEEIKPFLDWSNSLGYTQQPLNEILVNWYEDGKHYIGAHSDDERELMRELDGGTIVVSITLQETSDSFRTNRTFRLKPKIPFSSPKSLKSVLSKERIDIDMPHGLCLVMGGKCQRTHKHQVPKTTKSTGRRINITCRCFKI